MSTEGPDAAAPLSRADIPELVKAVAEALAKPTPSDGGPGASSDAGGKLFVLYIAVRDTSGPASQLPGETILGWAR